MRFKLPVLNRKNLQRGFIKITKSTLVSYLIVATIFFGGGLFYLFNPFGTKHADAAWFNENWAYRKAITVTITSSASDITNLDTLLTIDTDDFITAGKLQSACQDLRFTDVNGNIFPYYIDSGCNGNSTKVWVRVNLVPKNTTTYTIYMYYGNPSAVTGSNPGSFDSMVNLIAYWTFNDGGSSSTATDSSVTGNTGNLSIGASGTQTTATQAWTNGATGKYGGSINLDGTDDQVTTTTQYVNPQVFTLEAWFKTNVASGNKIIGFENIQTGTGAANYDRHIWMGTDGLIRFGVYNGSFNILTSTSTYTDNTFHHVAVTHDSGGNSVMYIDGVRIDANNSTIDSYTGYWRVGGYETDGGWLNSADGYFDGQIDDVKIYNSARTAEQIAKDFANGSCGNINCTIATTTPATIAPSTALSSEQQAPQPVVYWKFDDGTGTTAKDATANNNNGTLGGSSGPSWLTEDQCISSKCLYFEGVDGADYITSASSTFDPSATDFTASAWVKTARIPSSVVNVIIGQQDGTGTGRSWMQLNTSGNLVSSLGGGSAVATTSTVLTVDTWYFVTFTKTGSGANCTYTIYVNGVQSGQATGKTTEAASGSLVVGHNKGLSSNPWKGQIDEVRVYNYALSQSQILANYNARSNPQGASSQTANILNNPPALSNGLALYWKLDEASGLTKNCAVAYPFVDSSGNSNNGTSCPSNTGPDGGGTGKFGNGVTLDGSNDFLDVSASSTLNNASFSLSGWFKPSSLKLQGLFSKNNYSSSWRLFENDANGTIEFDAISDGTNLTSGSNKITSGVWNHIAATFDATTRVMSIYINGVQVASQVSTIDMGGANNSDIIVGVTDSVPNNAFGGTIDEIRVYRRALSNNDISQLYNWAPGPSGYWRMDDNTGTTAIDSSGNGNSGTLENGSYWVTGKYGPGTGYDGVDEQIQIGSSIRADNSSAGTMSAWVYLSATGSNRAIFCYGGASATNAGIFYFYVNSSNFLDVAQKSDGAATENNVRGSTALSANAWYYVTLASDGSAWSLYLNGIPESLTVVSGSNNGNWFADTTVTETDRSYIGRKTQGGSQADGFYGKIDDFKIYNYPRTTGQIVQDMNAGHPAPGSPIGSPVGYWKFNEGALNTCSGGSKDACNSGSQGTTLDGDFVGNATYTQSGKFGRAMLLDGTGDYAEVADNSSIDMGTSDWTVSGWIKHATSGDTSAVVQKRDDSGTSNAGYQIQIQTGDKLHVYFSDGSATRITFSSNSIFADDTWHHFAVTFDRDGSATIYRDGKPDGSSSISAQQGDASNSRTLRIGASDTSGSPGADFNGTIDEIKIFTSALTGDQVKTDMNRSAGQVQGALSTTNSVNTSQPQAAASEYCVPGDTASASCAAPKLRWDFEQGTGTSAFDTSGNGFTGTLNNMGTTDPSGWATGKVGKGVATDGSDDSISNTSFTSIANLNSSSYSFGGWFNWSTASGTQAAMVISNTSSDSNAVVIGTRSGGSIRFEKGGGTTLADSSVTPTPFTWYHVYATYDGTTSKIYINGALRASSTSTTPPSVVPSQVYVGRFKAAAFFDAMSGKQDNVKIYDYVRTPGQIAWEYNKGAPFAQWKMDDCQGTTINDSSGNGYTGTLTIGSGNAIGTCSTSSTFWGGSGGTGAGKQNYAPTFDGSDDYVTVSDNALLRGTSAFTVAGWVKLSANDCSLIDKDKNTGYNILIDGSSHPRFLVGGSLIGTSTLVVNGTTWYHLAMTIPSANGTARAFVNGNLEGTFGTTAPTSTTSILIGRRQPSDTNFCNGQIDDVRYYNYALSDYQIKALVNQGPINFGPASGLP